MSNDVAILVNSCDKNSDLWDIFFYFYKKNCSNLKYKVYLNTETKKYKNYDVININQYTNLDTKEWSLRLKRALNFIKEDYVIMLLDDYFITELNNEKLQKAESIIKRGDTCVVYTILNENYINNVKKNNDNFYIVKKNMLYQMSLQIGLWNKNDLLKLLVDFENPWDFEIMGSKRIRRIVKTKDIAFQSLNSNNDAFIAYQQGIMKGKWLSDVIPMLLAEGFEESDLFKNRGSGINDTRSSFELLSFINYYTDYFKRLIKYVVSRCLND